MTIDEVLAEIEEVKPHQYDNSLLIRWLGQLEGKIVTEIENTE